MRILKLKGKTEEAILKEIEREYGNRAIIISTQKEQISGHFKWFKSAKTVVTIAIKEAEDELETQIQNLTSEVISGESDKAVQDSYELLIDLKNELGKLHQEIGEIKKSSAVVEREVGIQNENITTMKKNKFATYIQNRLIHLGVKPEICELLLAHIETEESETFIRELFTALEELLIEKPKEELPQIIFFI
ncbi:MAG: hypothetical protein H9872_05980, partial [Candidatus Cellulosilyticum pullistercoris]|nr:hypothetical protein [Candidatus Cellulosilyticum pullistercoris]